MMQGRDEGLSLRVIEAIVAIKHAPARPCMESRNRRRQRLSSQGPPAARNSVTPTQLSLRETLFAF